MPIRTWTVLALIAALSTPACAQIVVPAPGGGGGDSTAPAAATLTITAVTATSIALTWTAPGDDGWTGTASSYQLRYSTNGPCDNFFAWSQATPVVGLPAPAPASTPETFTVTGLLPGTAHWFCLRTADEVPNWSQFSNSAFEWTLGGDATPPSTTTSLTLIGAGQTSVTLSWTAPGDDGAVGVASTYDVRFASAPILTDADFAAALPASGEPAPSPSGTTETFAVTGLTAGTLYYFALKTGDEIPNWSGVSNTVAATTQGAADTIPPAAVSDLVATGRTKTSVDLRWTSTGDDGMTGSASVYDVRVSTSPIASLADFLSAAPVASVPAPSPSGSVETLTVTGLAQGTTYFVALRVGDEVNNWSGISNVVMERTLLDAEDHAGGDGCSGSAGRGAGPGAMIALLALLTLGLARVRA